MIYFFIIKIEIIITSKPIQIFLILLNFKYIKKLNILKHSI